MLIYVDPVFVPGVVVTLRLIVVWFTFRDILSLPFFSLHDPSVTTAATTSAPTVIFTLDNLPCRKHLSRLLVLRLLLFVPMLLLHRHLVRAILRARRLRWRVHAGNLRGC